MKIDCLAAIALNIIKWIVATRAALMLKLPIVHYIIASNGESPNEYMLVYHLKTKNDKTINISPSTFQSIIDK